MESDKFRIIKRDVQYEATGEIPNPDETEWEDRVVYPPARVFTAEHRGIWLGGCSVVRAFNEAHARDLLNAALEKAGITQDEPYELRELPEGPIAIVLWDGDY